MPQMLVLTRYQTLLGHPNRIMNKIYWNQIANTNRTKQLHYKRENLYGLGKVTFASSTHFTPRRPNGFHIDLPDVALLMNTHVLQTVASKANPPRFKRRAMHSARANLVENGLVGNNLFAFPVMFDVVG